MTESLQTVLALSLVVAAVAWLSWRSWRRRKNPGCGGDCACPHPAKAITAGRTRPKK